MHGTDTSEVMTPRRARWRRPARTRRVDVRWQQSKPFHSMQRESSKVLKHTKSVQMLTEAVAENFAVLTGVRPDVDSEARVLYHTIGRGPVLVVQSISLEVNRKIVVPKLSCRQFEAILSSMPELVTKEELLIDFVTSISSEEEEAKESQGSSSTGGALNPTVDEKEVPIVVLQAEASDVRVHPVNSKSIQPKPRGAKSSASSVGDLKTPARPRTPRAVNLELEKDLEDALAAHDLQGFTPMLVKARMVSMSYLKRHSVQQLQEALKGVGGKSFAFSEINWQLWVKFGLDGGEAFGAGAAMDRRNSPLRADTRMSSIPPEDEGLAPGADEATPPPQQKGLSLNW